MKAATCTRYGPPEVINLVDLEKPDPKPDEVLIRIHATTVTAGDWRIRSLDLPQGFRTIAPLIFGFGKPRQPVLGSECSGTIEAIGASVTRFKPGDAVFAFSGMSLRCHAQYKCMKETGAIQPKPQNLSHEEAAALPFGGTTMLDFFRRARLAAGEKVLVNAWPGRRSSTLVVVR